MAKTVREWRANTTGNPTYLYMINLGINDVPKYLCRCSGVLEYIYGCWWKCRQCNGWSDITPKV